MHRGDTEARTCELNAWEVGTMLRGHEQWGSGDGVWTTIRITAIGEESILARCLRHERTNAVGEITGITGCEDREHTWTLAHREWQEWTADE